MQPNKPQSNYSKKPIKRIRLLKIGSRKSKSLFEEYFYSFAIAISMVVTILGKAGGLSGYDAIVMGLRMGRSWVRRANRERGRSCMNGRHCRTGSRSFRIIGRANRIRNRNHEATD